jgi:hypothetical protein
VCSIFKNLVCIFVGKTYKMGCLEGSGVPVLYIGRTVTIGQCFPNCGPRTTGGPLRLNISPKKTEKIKLT